VDVERPLQASARGTNKKEEKRLKNSFAFGLFFGRWEKN
jgi:hypothetical protein